MKFIVMSVLRGAECYVLDIPMRFTSAVELRQWADDFYEGWTNMVVMVVPS